MTRFSLCDWTHFRVVSQQKKQKGKRRRVKKQKELTFPRLCLLPEYRSNEPAR